ncbi:MAG: hypothetical protein ACR2RL_07105 [Gammaproteobacteria bacterium]
MQKIAFESCRRLLHACTAAIVLDAAATCCAHAADPSAPSMPAPSEEGAWTVLWSSTDPEIFAVRTLLMNLYDARGKHLGTSPKSSNQSEQTAIRRLEHRISQLEREIRLMHSDIARLKRRP